MDLTSFPRANLGTFPTPLQLVSRLGQDFGHRCAYFKRDDLTGLGLGGNKTRSLEFLLGDALAKQATVILTAGGLQSNLCSQTAAACAKIGKKCVLVHNDAPTDELCGNMLLNKMFGAEQVFVGQVDEDTRTQKMVGIAERLRAKGETPYVIHNGASTPMGALGYANAAIELYNQSICCEQRIKHVAIVGAMGGTASGFVFGTAMLGHPFHVHVISVEYSKPVLRDIMAELTSGIAELTGLTPPVSCESVMSITDEYLGDGYAIPTAESEAALLKAARLEGILLENVYTSKTLAGLADLVRVGAVPVDEPVCYIHTGGTAALFSQQVRF